MPDINISQLYSEMQTEMLQTLRTGAAAFTHPGTKGDNTEVNWIEWFCKYLPSRYKVDKAIIIDSTGKCSDQIDLVIYDAQYSYLVFQQQDSKLIPAESVYAIFEVKQNLNKEHMEYAQGKAESVRSLFRSSAPIQHAGGHYDPKPLHEILAGVLTTKSDWATPIAPKVTQYINATDHNKRLDFVCSISDNTFVVDNNIFISQYDAKQIPAIRFCEKNDSLVFLLLNLLKRLQDIGTVPAIDYTKYANIIKSSLYKST
ncbi:DUF6602 domain-containing protein [uncultured Dysosmobacter sp.]|uniref:DUF6602 domain-containing protein n=1 Tax=uncultured Dysosmobacter sp. TaxID=2591384 RepID=UPI002615F1C5|nr:DUF6602 domain-containing protein [uncultured Dysosmobacter sp.]